MGPPLCISFFDRFHLCNKLAEYCCRNRWFQICFFFPFSFHFSLCIVQRGITSGHTRQDSISLLSAVSVLFPTKADYYLVFDGSFLQLQSWLRLTPWLGQSINLGPAQCLRRK